MNALNARFQVFTHLQPFRRGVEVFLQQDGHQGICYQAKPLEMEEFDPCGYPAPSFSLDPEAVQMLMDSLWNCGFRPSEGSGSAGQLASVQYHLEDMRKLVFEERIHNAHDLSEVKR